MSPSHLRCSIHGSNAPCGCCRCLLTPAGRIPEERCPIVRHREPYTDWETGLLVGRQMAVIVAVRNASRGGLYR